MKQPLKILSAIDIPWNSGLADYAFEQARALRAAGHTVYFACPAGSAAMDLAGREGFSTFELPGRRDHLRLPQAVFALRAFCRKEGVDVVCAHTGRTQTIACLLGRPVIRVKADAKLPTAGLIYSRVAKVISASGYIQRLYLKAGLDGRRLALIPRGIKVRPVTARDPGRPAKVGIVGRLDPVKGHAIFLKAAAELQKRGLKAEFHIAGAEANVKQADLEKAAAGLGIRESVFFHGGISDVFGFMASCDAGVIASLASEAVSRVALEWISCGKPLVSTTAGSLPEFTGLGWLVPPGDHAAIADKLAALLSDPALLASAGSENLTRAEREYSPEIFSASTCAVFQEAAAAR
ncbi:MAG TPA: hypothetical protein DCZ92_09335 [Elusimicrobia bacterium]|nr:MAG: hypothetical protein A2016_11290 [Elusimicrobia bacterium GWF2_62_30]HBA61005.1 hypothetical protein [Elusimicrobiota bacterium]